VTSKAKAEAVPLPAMNALELGPQIVTSSTVNRPNYYSGTTLVDCIENCEI
jgi:hypothetical protein